MARQKASAVTAAAEPTVASESEDVAALSEPIQVNNASLQELKFAIDDFIKQHFRKEDSYDESHTHQDVHLALGWVSVLVCAAFSGYSYLTATPFAQTKMILTAGVVVYHLLAGLSWLWSNLIVKDVVFIGHRKIFRSRVQEETLTVQSKQLKQPVENPPLRLRLQLRSSASDTPQLARIAQQERLLNFADVFDSQGVLQQSKLASILDSVEQAVQLALNAAKE